LSDRNGTKIRISAEGPFPKMVSENPYEVVKDGSTNPGATGAVEPFVAVSQVDSKTGEEAAGAETEAGE
jgi:hypothetical protein